MRRTLPLVLLLLPLAFPTSHAGAAWPDDPPVQWSHAAKQHGALWVDLSGLQDEMTFTVNVAATGGYEVGITLLGPDAGWRYDLTGFPDDGAPARVDVRLNTGRTLDLQPALAGGSGTSLHGAPPCDGWIRMSSGWGGAWSMHSFGFDYEDGCDAPQAAQLLVWVATKNGAAWSFQVGAAEAVTAQVVETTTTAVHRGASDFPTRTRASATAAGVDATVGDAAELQVSFAKGARGSFGGWTSVPAGVRATATGPEGTLECPCGLQGGGAGAWTFRVEGAGVAAGGEMRLSVADTSFPW